jgi:Uma2 family endonuclease
MSAIIAEPRSKVIKRLPQPKLLTYDDYARLTPPDSGNYELHNGKIIFMPSPLTPHQIISMNLSVEMGGFIRRHKLGKLLAAPMDVRFTANDVVQPDLLFVPNARLEIIQRIVEGAPDLVIEIKSDGNTATDMSYKKYLYETNGVQEYWIVYPNKKTISIYILIEDELRFQRTLTVADTLKSLVLTGFEMPVSAVFE